MMVLICYLFGNMLPLLRIATLMAVRYGEARWAGQPIVTGCYHCRLDCTLTAVCLRIISASPKFFDNIRLSTPPGADRLATRRVCATRRPPGRHIGQGDIHPPSEERIR